MEELLERILLETGKTIEEFESEVEQIRETSQITLLRQDVADLAFMLMMGVE